MSLFWTRALLCLPLATLTACAAHPLPEDVTRKSTFAIVQQLRCEARAGIIAANLSGTTLEATYIGFDFQFDITENNKATAGSLGFTHPFSDGKFLLNFSGGAERTRQAQRFVRVVQLFSDLKTDTTCGDNGAPYANLVYPIAGKIGLDEVVGTYAAIRRVTGLRKRGKDDKSIFSDELAFTTQLDAGVTPKLEINAVGGQFKLTSASINGTVQRKDIHKVTIAIARKVDIEADVVRSRQTLRRAVSPGIGSDAANVIDELDRLRQRNDDSRVLESLKAIQP